MINHFPAEEFVMQVVVFFSPQKCPMNKLSEPKNVRSEPFALHNMTRHKFEF